VLRLDWYEDKIESEVRDVVRLMRNNGFNTTSSCEGHKVGESKWVMFDIGYQIFDELHRLDELLVYNGYSDFTIQITYCRYGHWGDLQMHKAKLILNYIE
jgi:hypothetical protein